MCVHGGGSPLQKYRSHRNPAMGAGMKTRIDRHSTIKSVDHQLLARGRGPLMDTSRLHRAV